MALHGEDEDLESNTGSLLLPSLDECEGPDSVLKTTKKDAAEWRLVTEFSTEQDANDWFRDRWYTKSHKQYCDGLLLSLNCMQHKDCPAQMQALCRDGERSVFLYEDKLKNHADTPADAEEVEDEGSEAGDIEEGIRSPELNADLYSSSKDSAVEVSQGKLSLSRKSNKSGASQSSNFKRRFSTRLAGKSDASSLSSVDGSPKSKPNERRLRSRKSIKISSQHTSQNTTASPAVENNMHRDRCTSQILTGDLDGWNNPGAIKHIESKYPITENVKGRSIDVVVGVAYHFGTLLWMVQFEGREDFSLVRSAVMNLNFPDKVISYYERRRSWKGRDLEVNLTHANPALKLITSQCDCQTAPY